MKIYDISVTLGADAVNWPELPIYQRELVSEMARGDEAVVSKLTMVCHVGTHIDTPSHFIAGARTLDDYPIERWIVPAQVIDIKDKQSVKPAELAGLDIKPGEAILFRTDNSRSGRSCNGVFSEQYVFISPEASDMLVEKKVGLVGIDYASVDGFPLGDAPAHYKLLGGDILLLEGINLKDVPPGKYTLYCMPLKLSGAEGAPARAVLVS